MPASYQYYEASGNRVVASPADDVPAFLERELSLGGLADMLKHLWFAGAKHPATPLHFHVAMGREIVVADRMDLHLLWDNGGKLFLKPVPRFLLDPTFWRSNLRCPDACACRNLPVDACRGGAPRKVASGFLYTYACLISSESDFFVANENHLLPRRANDATIEWADWKALARELLEAHDPGHVHPRFHHAELRLSRINIIHYFTRLPPFDPYIRGWRNYSSLFRDNLAWTVVATIFIALVLTAMQVGLATERLQGNAGFQRASYGFTVFAILGPMCAFGLVFLGALFNLVRDLPWLLRGKAAPRYRAASISVQGRNSPQPTLALSTA